MFSQDVWCIRRNSNSTAVWLLLMLLTSSLLVAMEVFHQIEESLSHLAGRQHAICLASNVHSSNSHGHHHHHYHHHTSHNQMNRSRNAYPTDLFGLGNEELGPDQDQYPCFFEPAKLHQEPHVCSHSQFHCPIKVEYIPITMNGFNNASNQICHSLQALEDNNNREASPVNLLIVGGSVTWGGLAGGCMKGTCAELRSDGYCILGHGGVCAWVPSVVNYLQHRYKTTLNLVDLSWGATTSCTLPHTLIQRLTARNISLTSRDLLFYDYSVNDGIMTLPKLRQCMEENLEKLVHYSRDGLPPTIVFFEFYPFKGLNFHVENPEIDSYSTVYREVARKFHLPIISYRDLFWHPLFRADLKQYPKLEYIVEYKWSDPAKVDVHPPWVVHDIYADMIAGVLELTYQLCTSKRKQLHKEADIDDLWMKFQNTGTTSTTSEDGVLVLLNEEAEMKIANAPYLSPEEISALPYGWNLYQDRRGKPGWIIEGKVAKPSSKIKNRPALTFSFVHDKNSNTTTNNNEAKYNGLATLETTHMQTYRNAGGFRVQVCNVFLSTWADTATQRSVVDTLIVEHFTSVDVAVFKVDLNLKNCNPKKSGGGVVEVKIYPENIYDQHSEARGTQKVKITSVRLTVPK
jgi:hypothetical protein